MVKCINTKYIKPSDDEITAMQAAQPAAVLYLVARGIGGVCGPFRVKLQHPQGGVIVHGEGVDLLLDEQGCDFLGVHVAGALGYFGGTLADPIPYSGNMALESGKYYIQDYVIYLCNRDTINPVYNPLAELVGLYVETV